MLSAYSLPTLWAHAFAGCVCVLGTPAAASTATEAITSEAEAAPIDGGTRQQEARRETLFAEAVALSRKNRWTEASKKIREVLAIRSTPKVLIALGYTQIKLDQFLEARATLDRARNDAAAAKDTGALARAQAALARLEKLTPQVTLRLRDDVRLTAVEVDGRAVEVSRREFPVDPGERRILVRGACGGTVDAILSAQRGGRLSVDATGLCVPETPKRPQTTPSDLHMPEAERAPPKLATDDPASPFPLAPTLLGAAGILTAGLGSYLYFDGRADHTAAISQCGKTCGSTEWNLQFEEASSRMLTGDILLGAGGALIVSSIVWWLIQDDGTQNETEATPTVGISPVEGGAYGSVLGTF